MSPDINEEGNVESCEECPKLVECRSQIVNGVGDLDADVMLVGEAPGQKEDKQGEPFVGRSGKLLTEILNEKGEERSNVRITNCARCRPPENRDPTDEELENCKPHLDQEIAMVEPDIVVTLGSVPTQTVLEKDIAVTKKVGDKYYNQEFNGYKTTVMVGLHPAFILRDGSYRSDLESVIQEAIEFTDGSRKTLDDYT